MSETVLVTIDGAVDRCNDRYAQAVMPCKVVVKLWRKVGANEVEVRSLVRDTLNLSRGEQ